MGLGVPWGEGVAEHDLAGHQVRDETAGDQQEPGGAARPRPAPALRRREVHDGDRHEQQHPAAARGRAERAQHTGHGPALLPGGEEDAHRKREEQRLRVCRGEEQRGGKEGQQEHGAASRGGPKLERGQAVQRRERDEERDERAQGGGDHVRPRDEPDRVHEQRIDGEVRRLGLVRISVRGDVQVPDRVPTDDGRREHVADAAEVARQAEEVELSFRAVAGDEERAGAGDPDQQARTGEGERAGANVLREGPHRNFQHKASLGTRWD